MLFIVNSNLATGLLKNKHFQSDLLGGGWESCKNTYSVYAFDNVDYYGEPLAHSCIDRVSEDMGTYIDNFFCFFLGMISHLAYL